MIPYWQVAIFVGVREETLPKIYMKVKENLVRVCRFATSPSPLLRNVELMKMFIKLFTR